jgi:glycosyltransferase involved in cell wall biosynthesis
MRFAYLHHIEPITENIWSGTPINIVRTLREQGHEVVSISGFKPRRPLIGLAKTAFYRYLLNKKYLMNKDPRVIKIRAKDLNRRLREIEKVDAVLCSFPSNAAYLDTQYSVVLIHDMTWTQLLDYYPGAERKTLAEETVRGGIILEKLALQRCNHAIFCSQWAAASAIEEFVTPRHKVSVAPLGASIKNAPTRDDVISYLSRRGHGPMKLLFLGKQWFRKGGDIAVQVAAEIKRMGVEVELHIVGCNPEDSLPSFVRLHGSLHKDMDNQAEELRGLFETSDFFIMPSRAEAFGIVFAEAAAFGLPVMASDTGGAVDAVRGEWGIMLPPGASTTIFAEWAVKHFRNRMNYERLSWLARESYESKLNWTAFCQHLVRVVTGLAH